MPKYQNSTHQKHWVFSSDQLKQISEQKKLDLAELITKQTGDTSLLRYSTTEDEEKSVVYFLSINLIKACKHFHMHTKAVTTALTYFKRFYLNNSICVYDPVQMMFTAMFLSCKTEEINVRNVEDFCNQFKGSEPETILRLEYALVSGIKFHLYVFCPSKPLKAFIDSIDLMSLEKKQEVLVRSQEITENFLLSDGSLCLSPSEIAVICCYVALEGEENREEVMAQGFQKIGKKIEDFKEKMTMAIKDYREFCDKIPVYEANSKAAMKKAGSLRHRLKKTVKPQ